MRVAVAQFFHETNTFGANTTTLDHFRRYDYLVGEALIERYANTRHYLGGILATLKERGDLPIPLLSASMTPSGLIEKSAFDHILADLLERLGNERLRIDGVCLALHGAAVVEGVDDPEGYLLQRVREIVGSDVPIVATLDLHGNVTDAMAAFADGLFGVHYYPHTDQFERGEEAVSALHRIYRGEIHPVIVRTGLGMTVPSSKQYSHAVPASAINQLAREYEERSKVIDCTVFWGFGYADVPHMGVSVLVTTDGDTQLGTEIGRALCEEIWSRRELLRNDDLSPREAVALALSEPRGPVVISEGSDNPGAGSAGDATSLLAAMLEANVAQAGPSCFGFIADPEVVAAAHTLGVGGQFETLLGGKTDCRHGDPLAVRARVKVLSDGQFRLTSKMGTGIPMNLGRMARLEINGIDVLVSEEREQVFDEEVFRLHGIEPSRYRIVGLKSNLHFRAAFDLIATRIIHASGEGISRSDIAELPFRRIQRPLWPLDEPTKIPLR